MTACRGLPRVNYAAPDTSGGSWLLTREDKMEFKETFMFSWYRQVNGNLAGMNKYSAVLATPFLILLSLTLFLIALVVDFCMAIKEIME